MEKKGFFKIDRNLFDNDIFLHPQKLRLFLFILGNARYKDGEKKIGDIVVKKGQYLRSYRKLQEDLRYLDNNELGTPSLGYIKRAIYQLVDEKRLEITPTRLGTLFTVCNYCEYQDTEKYVRGLEQTVNRLGTDREQTVNNTERKGKKDKKGKEGLYSLVVSYLNERAGTHYRASTSKTKSLINARVNEGFKVNDFKTVIDKKTNEWIGTKYEKYLRPQTLFGTNFESYLNQKVTNEGKNSNAFLEMMGDVEDD